MFAGSPCTIAKEKKVKFFSIDSPLYRFMQRLTDVIVLNILAGVQPAHSHNRVQHGGGIFRNDEVP